MRHETAQLCRDLEADDVSASMEDLEARCMMAAQPLSISEETVGGGLQLRITGTGGDDQISVSQSADGLVVKDGAWSGTYSRAYKSLFIDGGAGNDVITLDPTVTVDSVLEGGAGNDSLTGGSGNDRLYGGLGTNALYGAAGDDVLVSVGGSATDKLTGGTGQDSFWLDSASTEKITDATSSELASNTHRISSFSDSKMSVTTATAVKSVTKVNGKKVTAMRTVAATKIVAATKDQTGPDLIDPAITKAATGYSNYSSHVLFEDGGPQIGDVNQGQVGDCYYLSVLASVAKARPNVLRQTIVDLGDGTYAVQFRKGASAVYIRVDADLPVYAGGSLAYAGFGAQGSLWVALVEKAWAVFRSPAGTYASIEGGWMDEGCKSLGLAAASTMTGSGQQILSAMAVALSAGKSVTFAVNNAPAGSNLISSHAYTVDRVNVGADGKPVSVRLRNPWGVDGYTSNDGMNDGYVTVTADQASKAMLGFTVGTFA